MGASPLLPLYPLLFPRSKRCEDGNLGLKSEEDGGGRDLATLQRAPGVTGQGDSVRVTGACGRLSASALTEERAQVPTIHDISDRLKI